MGCIGVYNTIANTTVIRSVGRVITTLTHSAALYQDNPHGGKYQRETATLSLLISMCVLYNTTLLLLPFYGPLDFVWDYPGELVPEK